MSLPAVQKDWSLTDELDDWSLIYSASPDWMLEGNNPYGGFDGDPSRLRRTALSRQEVIYHFNHITDFEADVYFHDSLEGLKFYTSPRFKDPMDATRHGIGMVYQEFMVFGDLSVLDNIMMGFEEKKWGIFLNRTKARMRIEEICRGLISSILSLITSVFCLPMVL